ncbi:MAG TPA: Amuc_1100 family pilus-like protein [Verrucomicrobiae bacterium]|jgi:hypothetical protein|nr:Amuc_1100 family pilus-like protein [Verrucomicrobiae bacterium]
MAWIKRNLIFVITMAVGVILIGVAGYFVYTAIGANADARDQYNGAVGELSQLQDKKPHPSTENIQVVTDDSKRVATMATNFGKAFVNFPTPPPVEPREFKKFLTITLNQFRAGATNANVELADPEYAFSFSAETSRLTFPEASFGPWMEQLEEIKAILDILYAAKINSLDGLQRCPAPSEDPSGADFLASAVTSNQVSIIAPYKISFRGFSEEIANVLKGFASSSHCFLIKDLEVAPSKGMPAGGGVTGGGFMPMAPAYSPMPFQAGPSYPGRRGGRYSPEPMPVMPQAPTAAAVPAAPTAPVTILKPMPLFVTMVVDVVKLKNPQR